MQLKFENLQRFTICGPNIFSWDATYGSLEELQQDMLLDKRSLLSYAWMYMYRARALSGGRGKNTYLTLVDVARVQNPDLDIELVSNAYDSLQVQRLTREFACRHFNSSPLQNNPDSFVYISFQQNLSHKAEKLARDSTVGMSC